MKKKVAIRRGRIRAAACAVLVALVIFVGPFAASTAIEDPMLARWKEFSSSGESRELVEWLRSLALARLTGKKGEELGIDLPEFYGRLGVFVTLKKGNGVRGCFGAFSHGTADARALLKDYLTGAMTRDPRHKPLDISELEKTEIILTITSPPFTAMGLPGLDARYYGFVIQCDNEETRIFVPAEIRQTSYIERLARGKSCQVSAFRAVTIR